MNITHLCQFCNLHELETVDHVITRCPLYDYERQSMLVNLQLGLSLTPLGLAAYHAIAELDQQSLTLVLLGQHDPKWYHSNTARTASTLTTSHVLACPHEHWLTVLCAVSLFLHVLLSACLLSVCMSVCLCMCAGAWK